MTNKVIQLDSDLVKELFHAGQYSRSKAPAGWEVVDTDSHWDGGEDRYNTTIVRNIEEDYLLEISNYYDSWDEYWDPMLSIVTSSEIMVKQTQYTNVEGTTVELV